MVSAVVAVGAESEYGKGVKARRAEPGHSPATGRPADHPVGHLTATRGLLPRHRANRRSVQHWFDLLSPAGLFDSSTPTPP